MPRRRLLLLFALLTGSLVLLFRPISEPVTREAEWALLHEPLPGARCPAPARGEAAWRIEVAGEFASLERALHTSLGPTCQGVCAASVVAELRPSWRDRPHFLSGFGRIAVPVVLRRQIGQCRDTFELELDARIDEGTRGSAKLAQLHTGRMIGGLFRGWYTAERPWPMRMAAAPRPH